MDARLSVTLKKVLRSVAVMFSNPCCLNGSSVCLVSTVAFQLWLTDINRPSLVLQRPAARPSYLREPLSGTLRIHGLSSLIPPVIYLWWPAEWNQRLETGREEKLSNVCLCVREVLLNVKGLILIHCNTTPVTFTLHVQILENFLKKF